jgi:Diguanylate cyclase, GGDEF domain
MNPEVKPESSVFSREERVRLNFLLRDLLPPPQLTWTGGEERGEEMWALHELLQRVLGRMQIGSGDGVAAILSDFIMKAREDELFTMIELIPVARAQGIQKRQSPFEQFTRSDHQHISRGVNQFLSRIGSPARFDEQGRFTRGGFVDQAPAGLKKLPGREVLQSDLHSLQHEALAIIYFDLDHFKQVNDTSGHSAGDKCLENVAEIADQSSPIRENSIDMAVTNLSLCSETFLPLRLLLQRSTYVLPFNRQMLAAILPSQRVLACQQQTLMILTERNWCGRPTPPCTSPRMPGETV